MSDNYKEKVLISCIIPVHNAEQYLEVFLKSLMNQTFREAEIICVDDASTDSSYSILKKFKAEYDMIIIKNGRNLGAGESRNKGLRIAKGEYVIFFDCDDILHPQMLEVMYNNCIEHKADVGISYVEMFSNGTYNVLGTDVRNRELIPTYPVLEKPLYFPYIFQIIMNNPFDKMIRRELILKNGIQFQSLPCSNDAFFSNAVMLCSDKIYYIDRVLYYYRASRNGSITTAWNGKKKFVIEVYDAIFDFLVDRKVYELVKVSFTSKVIKDIYCEMLSFSVQYLKETMSDLQKIYLEKWRILEQYNQNILTKAQKQIVDIIMEGKELVPYQDILLLASNEKIKQLMGEVHHENKKIVWWGAGKIGLKILQYFQKIGQKVDYVVDNDPDKQGREIMGYKIKDWGAIKEKVDLILVTNYAWINDIKKQIGDEKKIINIISYLEYS